MIVELVFMTITYIFHSCYLIEFDEVSLLFDFYEDTPRSDGKNWITDYLLNKDEDLYVFCSHSHSDHFNPEILSWSKKKKNVRYIFSDELLQTKNTLPQDATYLRKGEFYKDNSIKVKAFGSTDAGCSFLVGYNDKLLFHAGDLNNWHWKGKVSVDEALTYENNFLCELELLSERAEHINVAMFPLDPRLGNFFMRGGEQFVSRINTDYFLPMHFDESFNLVNTFEEIASKHNSKYLPITHRGQSYKLY